MTTFEDGPAKGQHLQLHRAVKFLRVVINGAGKVDALDHPEDVPLADEKLIAYQVVGTPGMCHILNSGGRGGFFAIATYQVVPFQPDDETMRDTARWRNWCEVQGGRE